MATAHYLEGTVNLIWIIISLKYILMQYGPLQYVIFITYLYHQVRAQQSTHLQCM